MIALFSDSAFLLGGIALLGSAIALGFYRLVFRPGSPTHKQWKRYVHLLDEDLKFLRQVTTGKAIASGQAVTVCLWSFLALAAGLPQLLLVNLLLLLVPILWLKRLRRHRIQRLGDQLDGWLQALANALKASASLGDAIASSQGLLHAPMSEEVDVLLKETLLGTPLDVAIQNMARRIGSRTISSALVTLLVARKSGGNLPHTLERSATALREMARLEGVVRTNTAAGKGQAYVLGAVPAVIIAAVHWIHPDLLVPLWETFIGNVVVGIALSLWIGAVILFVKILRVDI